MKNLLIRFFLFLFTPRKKNGNEKRILVVSTTALGDTLWATPSLSALKESSEHLSVLTSPLGETVLRNNPHIDQFFVLQEPLLSSFFSLWKEMKKEKFGLILIFHSSQRLTLPLCSLLGAKRVIGTDKSHKGLDSLLSERVEKKEGHEIERRFALLKGAGITPQEQQLKIYLTEEEQKRAKYVFGKKQKLPIVIHPGAKDGYKRWPKEKFIELGKLLNKKLDSALWISANENEKETAIEICGAIGNCGLLMLPLRDFAASLKEAFLLITNDTGPMHLATSVGCTTIALFSPTQPEHCGPYNIKNAHVIAKEKTCTPCLKRKCKVPFCLLQISPEEVFHQCQQLYEAKT